MTDNTNPEHLMTGSQIASIFGVGIRAVQNWAMPIKGTDGRANLFDIKDAIAYNLKRQTKSLEQKKGATKEEEEIFLMRARREKLEIQNATSKGELIPADVVEGIWTEQLGYFKSSANAHPAKVAREICEQFGITDQVKIEVIVRNSLNEALGRMSQYDPSEYMRRAGASVARITEELNEAEKAAIGVR